KLRLVSTAIGFGFAAGALNAQRGAPALPACTVPEVDTYGWKEFTADIAPVAFRVPADFHEHHFAHRDTFNTAPPNTRPQSLSKTESQTWFGDTPPRGLSLRRTKYDSTAPSHRAGSPQQRELTYCAATIGGLSAIIRSDRMIGVQITGSDTFDLYEAAG